MVDQPGERDPKMTEEKLLASRSRGGVVVNACPLDARAITFGGGIVDGKDQLFAGATQEQRFDHAAETASGHDRRASADGPKDVVKATEVGSDAGGSEPGGDGAPALGQQHAQQQQGQAQGRALVQEGTPSGEPGGQKGGQV